MEEMSPWYTAQILRGETEREQRRDSCPFWNPTSTMLLERAWVRSVDGRWQVVVDSCMPPSQGQRQKACTLLGMVTAPKEKLTTVSCLLILQR